MATGSIQTLLQMTQEILLSMQSDEVASITDTAESIAVATIIRRAYWDLFGMEDLPEHYTLVKLSETSTATPNIMTVPANCFKIEWLKYNVRTSTDTTDRFVDIPLVQFKDFMDRQSSLIDSDTNVASYTYTFNPTVADLVTIKYTNDHAPQWCGSPDDFNFIFDGFDSGIDTYLRATKTIAWGLVDPTFTFTDSFVPDLNQRQQAMLFNTAKAQCFVEMKQVQNATAEARSRRLLINAQLNKSQMPNLSPLDRLPNYGRQGAFSKRGRTRIFGKTQ